MRDGTRGGFFTRFLPASPTAMTSHIYTPMQRYTAWDIGQTLVYCWASVYDAGPTVSQRWANVSSLLGYTYYFPSCKWIRVSGKNGWQGAKRRIRHHSTVWIFQTHYSHSWNQSARSPPVTLWTRCDRSHSQRLRSLTPLHIGCVTLLLTL